MESPSHPSCPLHASSHALASWIILASHCLLAAFSIVLPQPLQPAFITVNGMIPSKHKQYPSTSLERPCSDSPSQGKSQSPVCGTETLDLPLVRTPETLPSVTTILQHRSLLFLPPVYQATLVDSSAWNISFPRCLLGQLLYIFQISPPVMTNLLVFASIKCHFNLLLFQTEYNDYKLAVLVSPANKSLDLRIVCDTVSKPQIFS